MNIIQTAWPLQRGTSAVDWCEGNYTYSPVIAEFVNTFSNILFFIYPPLVTKLFQEYAECVNRFVYVIWGLLLTVGLTSVYFHATLSLVGQLLDEVSIIWMFSAAFGLWLPRRYIIYIFKNRKNYQLAMFLLSVSCTILACFNPVLNAFALLGFGVFTIVLLYIEVKRCKIQRVVNLGNRSFWLFSLAYLCWISDRFFCQIWSNLHFPYLHGIWHILIAIDAYSACVLYAYFDACEEVPELMPVLGFWPSDKFELGVPYIRFKNSRKAKNKI